MEHKKYTAAVIGGSGYGGGEIIRRLLSHPTVELKRVTSIDYFDQPLSAAHLNLEGQTHLYFEKVSPLEAAQGVDVALFALPHEVSARTIPEVIAGTEAKIIDLSGAFRCAHATAYEKWYGVSHPHPSYIERFVYGLPEVFRSEIQRARCVANPGCFATCIELGLLPLAKEGWLKGDIETVAMTGSSGSGAAAQVGTHHPIRSLNIRSYQTLGHTQTPEIQETLLAIGKHEVRLSLVPVSAPLARGLWATSFVRVPALISEGQIREAFERTYADELFVRIPSDRLPEVGAVVGSNYAEVGVVLGEVVGGERLLVCVSALDNLIKGGAGQAVQNMNLVLGVDERLTLGDPGSWP
ncbi:MAG: N-acetyl-gamma-glutamyl-phosphate reductase [Myxococcales bacterium]|nr:N-acetyl-gamma-glutamyl-phosphate reductase [Myxococcales bacterium]